MYHVLSLWFPESSVPDSLALPKRSVVPKTAELQVSAGPLGSMGGWQRYMESTVKMLSPTSITSMIHLSKLKTVSLKFPPVACDCCWPPVHVSLFGLEANVLVVLTSLVLKQQHQILHHSGRVRHTRITFTKVIQSQIAQS